VHLTVVEDIEGMAPQIVASLKDSTPGLAQAERGRRLVEAEYDWQILADRLDRIWHETIDASRPRSVAGLVDARLAIREKTPS
jgi:hypothetical protein